MRDARDTFVELVRGHYQHMTCKAEQFLFTVKGNEGTRAHKCLACWGLMSRKSQRRARDQRVNAPSKDWTNNRRATITVVVTDWDVLICFETDVWAMNTNVAYTRLKPILATVTHQVRHFGNELEWNSIQILTVEAHISAFDTSLQTRYILKMTDVHSGRVINTTSSNKDVASKPNHGQGISKFKSHCDALQLCGPKSHEDLCKSSNVRRSQGRCLC